MSLACCTPLMITLRDEETPDYTIYRRIQSMDVRGNGNIFTVTC